MAKRADVENPCVMATGWSPNPPGMEVQGRTGWRSVRRAAVVAIRRKHSWNRICNKNLQSGQNIRLRKTAVQAGVYDLQDHRLQDWPIVLARKIREAASPRESVRWKS